MSKKLSIITNFTNCMMNCPYCIWKKSGNNEKYADYIWTNEFVKKSTFKALLLTHLDYYKKLNTVYSISGGSDPLVSLGQPASNRFYKILHNSNKKLGMKYQIHTAFKDRLFNLPTQMYDNLDTVVLHIMEDDQYEETCRLKHFLDEKNIKFRVTLVVTPTLKKDFCEKLEDVFKTHGVILSYREMWPKYIHPDMEWFKGIGDRDPRNRFIAQDDYNTYIMPDLNPSNTFIQGFYK